MKHLTHITQQRTPASATSLLVWQQLITVLSGAAAALVPGAEARGADKCRE